jgi:ethanolaminephosphotransferase
MVYIRQDKLPKLKEYKYSGVDHSLLSRYVLKPFYTNVVINLFPMSMAYVTHPLKQMTRLY